MQVLSLSSGHEVEAQCWINVDSTLNLNLVPAGYPLLVDSMDSNSTKYVERLQAACICEKNI